VLDKFAELITFALGLVAALAWNEAIQLLFTQLLQRISVILNHRALWMHESLFMEELRAKR
jgi:hypothetical protein